MDYYIKLYSTVEDFENRNPCDHFTNSAITTMEDAIKVATSYLDVTRPKPIAVVKVESDDQEEIEIFTAIRKHNFRLTWDGCALDIYIENGEDKDPTTVVYWVSDEWEEDSETVTPAMMTAMELYFTKPQELFNRLNLPYHLVD